jgi:hypothetical protein
MNRDRIFNELFILSAAMFKSEQASKYQSVRACTVDLLKEVLI